MDARPDRQPPCGFCDGTGVWADPEADPALSDPCPLCDGNGSAAAPPPPATDDPPAAEAAALARVLLLLPRLTPAERQRVYEELHARYDCRIYRS